MAKIVSFFNHKGGVGKTTLAYNVAWGLAESGVKVLMIDADPQANLTEITVQEEELYSEEQRTISKYDFDFFLGNNVYTYFQQYVEPSLSDKKEIGLYEKRGRLFLLPGSIRLAELDETISLSIAGINALRQVPDNTYDGLQRISKDFDYVIVDLSPALSAFNELIVELSDYFIIPVNPSIFSGQALRNLNNIFRDWNRNLANFDLFKIRKKKLPKMVGIVCQNYRPYSRAGEKNTTSATRFEERLEQLNSYALSLARDLSSFSMAISEEEFITNFAGQKPYRVANIPDYNQLSTISETEKMPVLGLTTQVLSHYKINTPDYRQKLEDFKTECEGIVQGLLKL